MRLEQYRTLGRSGLVVSPLALGTMTFGTARWGTDERDSEAIFNAYVEAGGNFVDTADVYAGGRSEQMLGSLVAKRRLRDQVVIATKAGFASGRGVHQGGSGAKHLHTALDGSLRRLATDYVDLFWLHVWDTVTPAEELLETMATLVRLGKVRYWGMSNAPAWYVAKVATLAAVRGLPGPIAMQYFYSLVNRDIEDEHVPLAEEFGMAIVPWSPLAYGLLTGKYDRTAMNSSAPGGGELPRSLMDTDAERRVADQRLSGANPFGQTLFTERNWNIVDVLRRVALEAGESPARIALAWVLGRLGVTSALMGVSRAEQIMDNAGALRIVLSQSHREALDGVSAPAESRMLYSLFTSAMRQQAVFGGCVVSKT